MSGKGSGLFGSQDDATKLLNEILNGGKKKDEPNIGCGTIILMLILALVAAPIGYAWMGFVLMMLWNWFMPAIGMVTINHGTAMGLVLIAHFFKSGLKVAAPEKEAMAKNPLLSMMSHVFGYWIGAGLMLGIGWVLLFFV
jgi:hypothetical protein